MKRMLLSILGVGLLVVAIIGLFLARLNNFNLLTIFPNEFSTPIVNSVEQNVPPPETLWGLSVKGEVSPDDQTNYQLFGTLKGVRQENSGWWATVSTPEGETNVFLGVKDGLLALLQNIENKGNSFVVGNNSQQFKPNDISISILNIQQNIDKPIGIYFNLMPTPESQNTYYTSLLNESCEDKQFCIDTVNVIQPFSETTFNTVGALLNGSKASGSKIAAPIHHVSISL